MTLLFIEDNLGLDPGLGTNNKTSKKEVEFPVLMKHTLLWLEKEDKKINVYTNKQTII